MAFPERVLHPRRLLLVFVLFRSAFCCSHFTFPPPASAHRQPILTPFTIRKPEITCFVVDRMTRTLHNRRIPIAQNSPPVCFLALSSHYTLLNTFISGIMCESFPTTSTPSGLLCFFLLLSVLTFNGFASFVASRQRYESRSGRFVTSSQIVMAARVHWSDVIFPSAHQWLELQPS